MEHVTETGAVVAGSSRVASGSSGQNEGNSDLQDHPDDTCEPMGSNNDNGDADDDKVTGKALREELIKLREAHQCKVCLDKTISVVFLPCGHLVTCTDCATAVRKCVICREPIKAFVKTFIS